MRTGSRWSTDPDWVARRKACAHSFIQYAPIHQWNKGPGFLDAADDENAENVEDDSDEDEEDEASDVEEDVDDSEAEAEAAPAGTELPPPAAP